MDERRADIVFLWLGEMLLIPHLWPIIDALARLRPDLPIDLWVSTSAHEALIESWRTTDHINVRLRRAPGFLSQPARTLGQNGPLPAKLPMLARLAPHLWCSKVVVCVEQTSLWLPRLLPIRARFILTGHGAGPPNYGRAGRLLAAWQLLIPSALDIPLYTANGIDPARIAVTGYAKATFAPSRDRASLFRDDRPILLYTPHWQAWRSSWTSWGPAIVRMLAAQNDWNVILAPHQRWVETWPEAIPILREAGQLPHVHVDIDSFAMVDGSYTHAADLYLGDTSSQILEFVARPRPCVLLRPPGLRWEATGSGNYWSCGNTVESLDQMTASIARANTEHSRYADIQSRLAMAALGDTSPAGPLRAAETILAALN